MNQFYMDTNVFISQLKPDDPYHDESRAIVRGLKEDEIRAETSVFTLLEVAAVSGRLYDSWKGGRGRGGESEGKPDRKVFIVRALMSLARLRVKFINVAGDTPLPLKGFEVSLPSVFNEAILLSLRSNLRTLDLIHLAAARHARRMNGELGAFVTGDKGFLAGKKGLAVIIGMPILSPREYAEGLGLK